MLEPYTGDTDFPPTASELLQDVLGMEQRPRIQRSITKYDNPSAAAGESSAGRRTQSLSLTVTTPLLGNEPTVPMAPTADEPAVHAHGLGWASARLCRRVIVCLICGCRWPPKQDAGARADGQNAQIHKPTDVAPQTGTPEQEPDSDTEVGTDTGTPALQPESPDAVPVNIAVEAEAAEARTRKKEKRKAQVGREEAKSQRRALANAFMRRPEDGAQLPLVEEEDHLPEECVFSLEEVNGAPGDQIRQGNSTTDATNGQSNQSPRPSRARRLVRAAKVSIHRRRDRPA